MKNSDKFSTGKFTEDTSQKRYPAFLNNKSVLEFKNRARFIVFEGLDGSGHTTQANLLKEFLIKNKVKVISTKEPTINSKQGRKIREILTEKKKVSPKTLQELFTEDRKAHLRNVIIPALKKGSMVICDRYFFSSFAYGVSDGLDLDWLIEINRNFLMPDLIFILKVKPEICLRRIKKRGEEKELFEKKEKLAKVWETYKTLPIKFKNIYPVRKSGIKIEAYEGKVDFSNGVYIIDGEKPIKEVFEEVKTFF
ncbi:MAG: dTMP kinase [Patescibacteria group bacterium]|nr:dTMP kinase [Patescibacteria group bacterium]